MKKEPEITIDGRDFLDTIPEKLLTCRFCGDKATILTHSPPNPDEEDPFGRLKVPGVSMQWTWDCPCGKTALFASTDDGETIGWDVFEDNPDGPNNKYKSLTKKKGSRE